MNTRRRSMYVALVGLALLVGAGAGAPEDSMCPALGLACGSWCVSVDAIPAAVPVGTNLTVRITDQDPMCYKGVTFACFLGFGLTQPGIHVGGVAGTLFLDPAMGIYFLAQGTTPNLGSTDLVLGIPANPQLAGLPLYFQVLGCWSNGCWRHEFFPPASATIVP